MPWVEAGEVLSNIPEELTGNPHKNVFSVEYKTHGQIVGRPESHFRVKLSGVIIDVRARSQHKARQKAHEIACLYSEEGRS